MSVVTLPFAWLSSRVQSEWLDTVLTGSEAESRRPRVRPGCLVYRTTFSNEPAVMLCEPFTYSEIPFGEPNADTEHPNSILAPSKRRPETRVPATGTKWCGHRPALPSCAEPSPNCGTSRGVLVGLSGGLCGLVEPHLRRRGGAAQRGDHHSAPFDVGQSLLCRPFDRRARCKRVQVADLVGAFDELSAGLGRPLLQSEHEQHRLVAHLAKLRRVDEPGPGVAAEPRRDGDVLLAAGLEGHRRRIDAGADIDFPQLLKA
jgi:hypothetical protein